MKKLIVATLIVFTGLSLGSKKHTTTINAQTVPYNLTVAWDASLDAVSYNCYLDGVQVINVVTATCNFPVSSLGAHTVGVTSVNSSFIPSESDKSLLSFTLKTPASPKNIRIK